VLEGTRGASVPVAPTDIYTFSVLGGRVIKTLVQVPTPFHASSGDGFLLQVRKSGHSMAKNLRTVALARAQPVPVPYADPFQALLFPGRAL
jgi:hypothetical protein